MLATILNRTWVYRGHVFSPFRPGGPARRGWSFACYPQETRSGEYILEQLDVRKLKKEGKPLPDGSRSYDTYDPIERVLTSSATTLVFTSKRVNPLYRALISGVTSRSKAARRALEDLWAMHLRVHPSGMAHMMAQVSADAMQSMLRPAFVRDVLAAQPTPDLQRAIHAFADELAASASAGRCLPPGSASTTPARAAQALPQAPTHPAPSAPSSWTSSLSGRLLGAEQERLLYAPSVGHSLTPAANSGASVGHSLTPSNGLAYDAVLALQVRAQLTRPPDPNATRVQEPFWPCVRASVAALVEGIVKSRKVNHKGAISHPPTVLVWLTSDSLAEQAPVFYRTLRSIPNVLLATPTCTPTWFKRADGKIVLMQDSRHVGELGSVAAWWALGASDATVTSDTTYSYSAWLRADRKYGADPPLDNAPATEGWEENTNKGITVGPRLPMGGLSPGTAAAMDASCRHVTRSPWKEEPMRW